MALLSRYHHIADLRTETLLVEGRRLCVRSRGEGAPPMVFIHGWADSTVVWRRSMAHWSNRYHTIALDQPGHGRSDAAPVSEGVMGIARRLATAIAMLGVSDVTLVGHSFGGMMALLIARYFSESVGRLVLVDAAWLGHEIMPVPLPKALRFPLMLAALTTLRPVRRTTAPLLAPLLTRVDERYQDQFRRWHALTQAEPWWLARTVGMIQGTNLSDELGKIVVPTLVMTGTADRAVPPRHTHKLAAQLPTSTFVEIQGAGHHPMEDDFPAFAAAIDAFLPETA